jgi:hypothetical protein
MVLDDIISAAKQSVLERVASPLLGSFVIAWCLWNWKFLVILFSDASVSQTFVLIEKHAFPEWTAIACRGILFPIATAAAYVFLYPYPARIVYGFTLRRQREINMTRQKIADETLLTLEESRRLRAEFVEQDRKQNERVRNLNEEIARLSTALEVMKAEEKPELSTDERLYDTLEPSQLFLLRILERADGPALESDLIKKTPEPRLKAEFDIGELERRKLLHRNFDQARNAYTLEFTHAGRRALLEGKASEA